jgi:lycopene cyclase domain-containing protein
VGIGEVLREETTVKEYTICALVAVVIAVALDWVLNTRLLRTALFWKFLAVMVVFKLSVNGYLTWRPIVMYDDAVNFGIRMGTIPVEDFLYGFALVTSFVVVWEYFSGKETAKKS